MEAVKEGKLLWPSNVIDVVCSLGTGIVAKVERTLEASTKPIVKNMAKWLVGIATDSYKAWKELQSKKIKSFRINLRLKKTIELDDVNEVDNFKENDGRDTQQQKLCGIRNTT